MYFQVSPGQTKQRPAKAVINHEEEIPELTLAPFTQIPKLSFQDVALNALHEIKLYVTNKKPVPVFVNACFDGPEELEFSQSWCDQRIEAKDTKLLELYWYPNSEYSERHNLKVVCAKQIWNVPITFKSVLPKKSKKKISTTLVKKTSPLLKKNVSRTSQKPSTASSKGPAKKQPLWNDKPYISKKTSHNKENINSNQGSENFRSSSNISFKISSPDNIRRFTYAVNKLGFAKEKSPVLDDSLEVPEDPPHRISLKGIQLNSSILDEIHKKQLNSDSISYLGTPISQFFKPSRVSSELLKKDQSDKNVVENPRVIRNLSFEMNCEVQPSLNISSETRIIGNLSSDSLRNSLDGNTFTKNNVSTRTYTKEDNTFEIAANKNTLDTVDKISIKTYNSKNKMAQTHDKQINSFLKSNMPRIISPDNHLQEQSSETRYDQKYYQNIKSPNYITDYCRNSKLNISSETYRTQEASFNSEKFDSSPDSFIAKSRQMEEHNMSTGTYVKDDRSFEQPQARSSMYSDYVFRDTVAKSNSHQEYTRSCIRVKNGSRENTSFEITKNSSKLSPKEREDVHNLFPIREEPTDESLRRTQTKRKSDTTFVPSPYKRQNLSPETWSKVGGIYNTRTSVQRATKLMTSNQKGKKGSEKENGFIEGAKGITYVEKKTLTITDPFISAATTAIDPFLTNTIYLDQDWIQRQEDRFKNWLNMLLTPPSELNVSDEGQRIDAAKLWRECSQKEVTAAPTKEQVCSRYHTSARSEALRRSALALYNSNIIHEVLSTLYNAIENKKIEIRQDRNIHLDLSLQSKVMSLLLSYNPLWLRIALETIYGEKLKSTSNSDMLGLSKFLYERFFKDRLLIRKHKTIHNPKYNIDIKKFMSKKFFSIVYFLDRAKINCLIPHDPCLFRKNATVKESREMLIQFTRDAITAGVGDITKYSKYFGYFVEHQQEYIHEFDYAVNSLGGDLRDGVRLTRVMESILLRNDITQNLRVPAISKLQKIHNVKLVFESLAKAGYEIQHDIEPHHIVEGHREKTLSFLWQIIYKFQAPLVIETAKNIQMWWRSLPICIKRMKLRRQYQSKVEAATKVQRWYRHQKQAKECLSIAACYKQYMEERKMERAAIKIQSFYRMYRAKNNYTKSRNIIIKFQRQCRLWLQNVCYRLRECAAIIIQKNVKGYLARNRFLQFKHSVSVIEKYTLARKRMSLQKQEYMQIKSSVIMIQSWYRATTSMRKTRSLYLQLKTASCMIQTRYRSKMLMKKVYNEYIAVKSSTILIQRWYRSSLETRSLRNNFLKLKKSVITIENRFIAQKEMRLAKSNFMNLKFSTIIIQRHLRATLLMRNERSYYLTLKNTVNFVKSKYLANKYMLRERENFKNLKKAAKFVQRRFRANKLMEIQRHSYLHLKSSTVIIQNFMRGYLLMKETRKNFMDLKMSTLKIQQKFRAYKSMCSVKKEYQTFRKAVISVQRRYRAIKAMQNQRQEFSKKKRSCVIIQKYFRGFSLMRKERQDYLHLKAVSSFIQQKYRAKFMMKKCQENYINSRKACIIVQERFRANKIMQYQRAEYEKLIKAVTFVKSKYIANKKMLENRDRYQRLKKYSISIQRIYRAKKMMKIERCSYLECRNMTIKIQKYVRGYSLMKKERQIYLTMRLSAIIIQNRFRAQKSMIQTRVYYTKMKQSASFIQRKFRANKLMKEERDLYSAKRNASISIQRYFRSFLLMKKERQEYILLRNSAIIIQQRYIAYRKMSSARSYHQTLKKYVNIIQTRFRANKLMVKQRNMYLEQRKCCILIQNYYKGYLLMKKERQSYLTLGRTVKFVQEQYRANKAMKISREKYLRSRQMVLYVQRKFRANQAMKMQRADFLKQREAAIKIQKYFRGFQQMKKDRKHFLSLCSDVLTIQKYARGFLTRRKYAHLLTPEAKEERKIKKVQEVAATKIQAHWRGYQQRKLSNKALNEIRKRSVNATRDAAPENSLESRSNRALDVLVAEDITVSLIISALTDFEYVTRRSPEICNKMGPLLPDQLYLLIISVARSLPDIQICEISACILINLCKYEPTRAMTWYPKYLDSMFTIMTNWCDKENMAFPNLCTLFWLFAHNDECKKTILQLPNINHRLEKIHSLVLRKQKMVMKSDKKLVNSRFISKKPLYLPSLRPDWGFDYPKRPRLFMNSVQAIECLIKILKSP